VSSVLFLLALKLTGVRRVSHVEDVAADPAAGLFAGLVALPKATALTTYSYRLDHARQRRFLAALDRAMLAAGLAEGGDFDLDFHAVMHWGEDAALEKHYVPRRSQRTRSVLTFFAQDAGTHNLVYANADISKADHTREVLAFYDHWRAVSGTDPVIITNDRRSTPKQIIERYARRMTIEQRLAEAIRSFHLDALSSAVPQPPRLHRRLCGGASARTGGFRRSRRRPRVL
jgi:hypothetical protein